MKPKLPPAFPGGISERENIPCPIPNPQSPIPHHPTPSHIVSSL
ncbi:MAG: hypothetical protein AAF630_06065 [Cyanobacteria bacterium P01_C01_bin.38]